MINNYLIVEHVGWRKWAIIQLWSDSEHLITRSKEYLGCYKSRAVAWENLEKIAKGWKS